MRPFSRAIRSAAAVLLPLAPLQILLLPCGCTPESVRVALETQRRADEVQQGLFERQHAGLRVLLYRDLVTRLAAAEGGLSAEQRAQVNSAWNERDLIEFWAVQFERSKALRLIGVDAALYANQSIVDLLIKSLETKADRVRQAFADAAAGTAARELGGEPPDPATVTTQPHPTNAEEPR